MISDEEGLGVTTHRSEGNPSERAQTRYYQPSGIHSSEKRIELCRDICKEYGKDVAGTEELSYSTSAEVSHLNSTVERTRCSHAETMNNGCRTKAEIGYASPEDDWLTPTVVKNGSRIVKDPDIPGDKKVKIECIIPKRIQTNDFQPSGTISPEPGPAITQ